MPAVNKTNHRTIDLNEVAHVVKFSPFELSCDLLAIGTSTRVIIMSYQTPEEKCSLENATFDVVAEIHVGTTVVDISWSPQTNLHAVPYVVKFFAAGDDNKVRCLATDLKDSNSIAIVGEHGDYINAVASEPSNGGYVASVSDDLRCCVWSADDDDVRNAVSFPLTSPGMAVCWHVQEPSKIMVAEKKGLIRFYSVNTQQAFMSLDCGQAPLISADWCHANPLRVFALAGSDWFVFDTSRSCLPLASRMAHSGGGQTIRCSRSHDYLIATTGHPGSTLKVYNMSTNQVVLSVDKKLSNGVSWHVRQPIIAIAGDGNVNFWIVDTV